MSKTNSNSLQNYLAAADKFSCNVYVGNNEPTSWGALSSLSNVQDQLGSIASLSVVVATIDQLATIQALIELDGVARRIVLYPPDLSRAHLRFVADSAEADLILIPTRPTAADLVTIKQTVDLVHASKRKAGFILNAFRPQLVEAKEIAPILAGYTLPIIGVLGDRIAYSRGLPAGLGGHELGDEQAQEEVMKLANKVMTARNEL